MKRLQYVILTITVFTATHFTGLAQNTVVENTKMTVHEIVAQKQKEERNKKNVLEFFQLLMGDHDYDAAEKYMGEYIQHDPKVKGNGMVPLKEFLTTAPQQKNRPKGVKVQHHLVLADGDYVYVQNRKKLPGKKMMVQHTFRLNNEGKIEEHWSTVTIGDENEGINPQPLF